MGYQPTIYSWLLSIYRRCLSYTNRFLTSLGELNFNKEFSLSTLNENEFEIESFNFPINNYVIINVLGQIIEERLNIESYFLQLNLKEYSKGIYFVRLRISNDKIYNLKNFKP
ncbi:MAG: T9SS type A sorting domain-containing protein [Bacteroidetes bacterium]|nr:T9SS type A sorting domain-containing protein [Bacteroidota bacterium]